MAETPEFDTRFGALVQEHFGRAVRYCARMLGDIGEGEEVAQQAFVKLFEKRRKPWEGGDPKPYLFRVLRNACIDHIRSRKRRAASGDIEQVAWEGRDLSGAEEDEINQAVLEAVGNLEDSQREAVLLRFFEGLSLTETAKATGRSVGATAMLLSRAKVRLKQRLGKLPAFDEYVTREER